MDRLRRRLRRRSIDALRDIANAIVGRVPAHFLHIRKTGGSAIWTALDRKVSARFDVRMHPHAVSLADIPIGQPVFFFVRDPVARFVSGFYDRFRQGAPRYAKPWSSGETQAFAHFQSPSELGEALYGPTHDLALAAMHQIAHVRSSYWDWLVNDDYLRSRSSDVLFVGRQERMERDFGDLCEILGVVADLPMDPATAHRDIAPRPPLRPRAQENLREWLSEEYRCIEVLASIYPSWGDLDSQF